MRIKNIIPEACHICGKQTSLAAIEPHPTHPEMEFTHFVVRIAGRSEPFPSVRGIAPSGVTRPPCG